MKRLLPVIVLAAAWGCAVPVRDDSAKDVEDNVRRVEFQAKESRTLSALAKIEESVANYVKTEKKIPENLDVLVPKYLAELPAVEIEVRGHRDTTLVMIYPGSVLRDGQVDGSRLKDTGRWGYVFNDRQVVVFIDCTHKSSRGRPWYQERGAY